MKSIRSRFGKSADKLLEQYTCSIPFDQRLFRQDIAGSIAHAKMLARAGIVSEKEAELICMGLVSIREEIERGEFQFRTELEDIHMNVEARLAEKIGEVAGKLHTARSRNDQIALDMRLYCREAIKTTVHGLRGLQKAILDAAEAKCDVIMPGYTHLQRAQPVLFAHHLLAYFEMLERDVQRFLDAMERTDSMPLGSGALAGVPYPVDRDFLAAELGFARVSQNSIDAVSDRDFVIDYQSAASITMMHLSRMGEEIVLWSSAEFGFVELDESFATGSSIMPQKKNPDVAELGRGKTGRVYGNLLAILTVMKALPLSYNRDLQEDKENLFDTVDTLLSTLEVFGGMLSTMKVNGSRMREVAARSGTLATDLADYLVGKGVPFRQAHSTVARLAGYAIGKGKELEELTIEEYRSLSPLFDTDVRSLTVDSSIGARAVVGGTAPQQVRAQLVRARRMIEGGGGI
jgi:argininosuccinate lyase